uniref:Nonstructural protein 1 n=1 Tax=Anisakis simplex TaxID=6269 RepID=A0A0M3KIH4_ANISI
LEWWMWEYSGGQRSSRARSAGIWGGKCEKKTS